MKKNVFIIIAFSFYFQAYGQHFGAYISEIYNQDWIIENNIKCISQRSISKSGEEYDFMNQRYRYEDGIKINDKDSSVLLHEKDSLKVCSKSKCISYQINSNNKIESAQTSPFQTEYYVYDEDGKIIGIIHNSVLDSTAALSNLIYADSRLLVFKYDERGLLNEKKIYVIGGNKEFSLQNAIDLFNSETSREKLFSICNYHYGTEGDLEKITVDYNLSGVLKRFRTIIIKTENKMPTEITWYAGDLIDSRRRSTRYYEYETY